MLVNSMHSSANKMERIMEIIFNMRQWHFCLQGVVAESSMRADWEVLLSEIKILKVRPSNVTCQAIARRLEAIAKGWRPLLESWRPLLVGHCQEVGGHC